MQFANLTLCSPRSKVSSSMSVLSLRPAWSAIRPFMGARGLCGLAGNLVVIVDVVDMTICGAESNLVNIHIRFLLEVPWQAGFG